MAKDAPGMRGYRSRNKDGELRNCKVKDKDLTPFLFSKFLTLFF
jgi:hypothetical protein